MTKKFIVNNRIDAWKTDDNKLSNCPLSVVAAFHKLQIRVSVRLLTIKISQCAREKREKEKIIFLNPEKAIYSSGA